MPLQHGSSQATFKTNVKEMYEAGHPLKQALAAAYRMKRQGRADGGDVESLSDRITDLPSQNIEDRRSYDPTAENDDASIAAGQKVPLVSYPNSNLAKKAGIGMIPNVMGRTDKTPWWKDRDDPLPPMPTPQYFSQQNGRIKRDQGGVAPWIVRNEARAMQRPMRSSSPQMHTGPIPSIVPGRTDRHNMKVPAGTYVLPADHVSGMGQGNTNAGFAILNRMFGMGPYGSKLGGIKHGSGPPHAPGVRMQKPFGSDEGGSRGHGQGQPVDVVTAGGEFNIPPHVVEAIGYPIWQEKRRTGQPTKSPLDEGHGALDQWVVEFRHQKHVPTLKNLPNPAKR